MSSLLVTVTLFPTVALEWLDMEKINAITIGISSDIFIGIMKVLQDSRTLIKNSSRAVVFVVEFLMCRKFLRTVYRSLHYC